MDCPPVAATAELACSCSGITGKKEFSKKLNKRLTLKFKDISSSDELRDHLIT